MAKAFKRCTNTGRVVYEKKTNFFDAKSALRVLRALEDNSTFELAEDFMLLHDMLDVLLGLILKSVYGNVRDLARIIWDLLRNKNPRVSEAIEVLIEEEQVVV